MLVAPDAPQITQGEHLSTTEDRDVELECVSRGGKPAAEVNCYSLLCCVYFVLIIGGNLRKVKAVWYLPSMYGYKTHRRGSGKMKTVTIRDGVEEGSTLHIGTIFSTEICVPNSLFHYFYPSSH